MQSVSRHRVLTRFLPRLALLGMLATTLSQCTSVKKADVVVSVKEQKLGLYEQGQLKKTYKISTSKFGLGDKPGSNCTPLGQHQVVAKIGHGLPAGAVLKSRRWNGEVIKPNAPGRDPIVSRILWLKGTENSNKNAFGRFIYIHGTPEERRLGEPASYGCVRMGMKDVVSVINSVNVVPKSSSPPAAFRREVLPPRRKRRARSIPRPMRTMTTLCPSRSPSSTRIRRNAPMPRPRTRPDRKSLRQPNLPPRRKRALPNPPRPPKARAKRR